MGHPTTISGRRIDPLNIDSTQFELSDIAHALARISRFNGHQESAYSVAQHSICCSYLLMGTDTDLRREALFHDATEAYLCDVPTPLKRLLPDYLAIEEKLDGAIRQWAMLPEKMSAEVKAADTLMLVAEAFVLHPALWQEMGEPAPSMEAVALINNWRHYTHRRIVNEFTRLAEVLL